MKKHQLVCSQNISRRDFWCGERDQLHGQELRFLLCRRYRFNESQCGNISFIPCLKIQE